MKSIVFSSTKIIEQVTKNFMFYMNNIYSISQFKIIDKIIIRKRLEMVNIINKFLKKNEIFDVLDVGTTNDLNYKSSNLIVKNLINIKQFKSISNQTITSNFFIKSLNKSITSDFSANEINDMSSDLVISNATIEHVGNKKKQIKMIENILILSKKIFIINTPNRFHPIEYHTIIPFIHWLPKSIHRKILKIIGLNYFSKEENLNLLSKKDLVEMLNIINQKISYDIFFIKFLGLKSNYIIIGEKKI